MRALKRDNSPNSHKDWPLAWRRILGHHFERVDVREREHSGGDEPRQAENRAHGDRSSDNEQVEMVAARLLQLKLFPIYNNGRDLLVHEGQYGGDQRRHSRQHDRIELVFPNEWNEPASVGRCWLQRDNTIKCTNALSYSLN